MISLSDKPLLKTPALFAIGATLELVLALLLAVPATARATPSLEPPAALSATDALQEVAAMGLCIVAQGTSQIRVYTPDELVRAPLLKVDGYVNGVVLLGKRPLVARVDNRPMAMIRTGADGTYQLKHMGRLSDKEFWSTFLPVVTDPSRLVTAESVRSYYSCFPAVPGYALSDRQEFSIAIDRPEGIFEVKIRQDGSRKLDSQACSTRDSGGPELYFLGGNSSRFASASEEFRQRLDAILTGIRKVETIMRERVVERVHFVDYDGSYNVYTAAGESDIWFYNQVFWNESVAELQVMAQHETLHILADRLRLPDNSRMRECFAELKGFSLFSLERFMIMSIGRPPDNSPAVTTPGGILFDFINEANFIAGMQGGHAQDDVAEFCTSFLHSLMYVDRLPALLDAAINMRDGTTVTLSSDQRQRVLDSYRTVLSILVEELPESTQEPMWAFFKAAEQTVDRIALGPSGAPSPMASQAPGRRPS